MNSRRLKFARGATAEHTETSLCRSCRNGQIITGQAINEEVVYCTWMSERIRFRVVECSMFDDRSRPTLRMMKEIAWTVQTDKKGHKIGFMSPAELREKREKERGEGVQLPPTPDELPETFILPDGTTETVF